MRGRTYALATRDGEDRTYRLSRMADAVTLAEPARRPAELDLEQAWAQRSAQFLAEDHLPVVVRVRPARPEELLATTRAVA